MVPKRRCKPARRSGLVVVFLAGCGWLPADAPATTPAPASPDAPLFHDWKVTGHVLGTRALISDYDAAGFVGRSVAVSDHGYASPWSGSCDQAGRQRSPRVATEIALEHDIAASQADRLGLGVTAYEYQLTCLAGTAPALTLYVGGAHAVTCWTGVCYLLSH